MKSEYTGTAITQNRPKKGRQSLRREKIRDRSFIKANIKVYLRKVFPSPSQISQCKDLIIRSEPQTVLSGVMSLCVPTVIRTLETF